MLVLLKRYDVTNGHLGQILAVDWPLFCAQ